MNFNRAKTFLLGAIALCFLVSLFENKINSYWLFISYDIGININALGTVTSLATVTIRTQISGYMQKIDFTEGNDVKKGDLLAEIDPRPYEATLAQAKGQLARDEAMLKGAQVDLARYQGLAAQNAVPHQTLDTQVALVAQDQGTVEADKASVKSAEVNLAYCRIVSPLDGRVGLRQVDQGNYVTPGDTNGIVVITQLQPISVLFTVPEDNLQAIAKRLQSGATLPTTALDRGGGAKIADGTLQTFDSQIDPTTGTIKLRAIFPNHSLTVLPGLFVRIRVPADQQRNALTVPGDAVSFDQQGEYLLVVNNKNMVERRGVKTGAQVGDRLVIEEGVTADDRVIVEGLLQAIPGRTVAPQLASPAVAGRSSSAGT